MGITSVWYEISKLNEDLLYFQLGLAVVDDVGRLVANISASDIKKTRFYPIVGQMIQDLYQPIKTFLRIPAHGTIKLKKKDHIPFFVTKHDTMTNVMEDLIFRKIHRIFVVDHNQRPIACISLSDLLKQFVLQSRR